MNHRLWILLAHVAVLTAALGMRLSSLPSARLDDQWLLADGDSYYHLRRVEQTLQRGGRVPMFDPWLSFPDGQPIQWHGGYDLMLSGLVTALCGADADRACLTSTCVISTPLLGVLATLLVLLLGRAAAGPWTGLAAGALFALYPFSAGSAAIGHVDHHVMEPLLLAAWFLALVRGRKLLAGVLAGIAFAVFPTALLPVGVTAAALGVQQLTSLYRGDHPDHGAATFSLTATVILIPVVWTGAFAESWEPSATSRFHLAVMIAVTSLLLLLQLIARYVPRRALLISLLVIVVVTAITLVGGWSHLRALARFFEVQGLWTGVVQQVPLATGPVAMVLLIALVCTACLASMVVAGRRHQPGMGLVALTALPLTLLGIVQIRFLMMASALLAVVIAHLLLSAASSVRHRLADQPHRTRMLGWTVVAGLTLIALVPLREYARPSSRASRFVDGVRLLRRLGRSAATDSRSSVLCDWNWGHHVLWLARMPTVASPFILSGQDKANVLARRALLTSEPQLLYRIMAERRARFLLVTGLFNPRLAARSIGQPVSSTTAAEQLRAGRISGWERLRLVDVQGSARLYELKQ